MDKRGSKSSKKERVKLRKKLLENGTPIVTSANNLTDDNLVKERRDKKKNKLSGKKRKEQSLDASDVDHMVSHSDDTPKKLKDQTPIEEKEENKRIKVSKKKREEQKASGDDDDKIGQLGAAEEDGSKILKHKSERAEKKKKKGVVSSEEVSKLSKKESEPVADEVYQISSVNADSSKGMKKWIHEYHQSRPGLKILQERIDDFIVTHEEKLEQEMEEREKLAEGGWTVVKHQKGRKKTTDAESGTAVGGVAQAAVLDKMGKKKIKDVGVDFYRFQKREAQRNEIMLLQSKFEEDKKRIQQLRAARKFRPY